MLPEVKVFSSADSNDSIGVTVTDNMLPNVEKKTAAGSVTRGTTVPGSNMLPEAVKGLDSSGNINGNIGVTFPTTMLPDVKGLNSSGNIEVTFPNNMLPDVKGLNSSGSIGVTIPNNMLPDVKGLNSSVSIGVTIPNNMLPDVKGLNSSGSIGVTIPNNMLPDVKGLNSSGSIGVTIPSNMLSEVKRLDSSSNIGVTFPDNMLPDVEVSTPEEKGRCNRPSGANVSEKSWKKKEISSTVSVSKRSNVGKTEPVLMSPSGTIRFRSSGINSVTITETISAETAATNVEGCDIGDEMWSGIETSPAGKERNIGTDAAVNVLPKAKARSNSEDSVRVKVSDNVFPDTKKSRSTGKQQSASTRVQNSEDANRTKKLQRSQRAAGEERTKTGEENAELGSGGNVDTIVERLETCRGTVNADERSVESTDSGTVETYGAREATDSLKSDSDSAKTGPEKDKDGNVPTDGVELAMDGGGGYGRKDCCHGDVRQPDDGGGDGQAVRSTSGQTRETICACERIDSALHTLKAELSAMRDQDLALLKQLIHINDNIRRLKRARWLQKAGRAASCGTLGARTRNSPPPGQPDEGADRWAAGGRNATSGRISILLRQQSEPGFLSVPFRGVSTLTSDNASFETINDEEDEEEADSVYGSATDLDTPATASTPGSPCPSFPTPSTPAPRSPSAYTSLTFTPEEVWKGESSYGEILKRNVRLWKWSVAREMETGAGDGHPRLQAFEHKRYRKLLRIHYSERKTNEYVRQRINTLAGKREPLLSVMKRRKLARFGRVNRHDSPAKTILQGTVEGGRAEEVDHARHGLMMSKSGLARPSAHLLRTSEDRDRRRSLTAVSSMAPQR